MIHAYVSRLCQIVRYYLEPLRLLYDLILLQAQLMMGLLLLCVLTSVNMASVGVNLA